MKKIVQVSGKGKVDYWKNSNQKQRWMATSLLYIEQRLNRVNGYRHLVQLRQAIHKEMSMKSEAA